MRTAPNPQFRLLHLFGARMASSFPFLNHFIEDAGIPDITFSCVLEKPQLSTNWEKNAPVYVSSKNNRNGPLVSIYRHNDYHIVRFHPIIDFYIQPEAIVAHLRDVSYDYLVEILFLGTIFSLWLELRGIPAIHASAVVVNHGAIGFLSTNKGGKSSLAAAFMQGGCPLLTDDILPVKRDGRAFRGLPGYPSMRMWPDQAEYFLGHYAHLEIVHPLLSKRRVHVGPDGFGTFCDEEQPLTALFIPERGNSGKDIIIERISARDALLELIRNSFSARIVEALGLQPQRMNFFARMVTWVPVYRLVYPEGFHRISGVRDVVLKNMK